MADYHRKILSVEQLRSVIAKIRRSQDSSGPSQTIVQGHGCFDIVHPGHIRYLEFARSKGDLLIVSITGDAAIDKGLQRPYIPQELRAENLAALEFVDYVVVDPNATASELLNTIRPDIYVKGHEYATSKDPRFLAERQVVESYGGRVVFSSGQVVFSSSRLVEEMPQPEELTAHRLRALCRRHGVDHRGLSALLGEMPGKRILVLGDMVIERYVLCDATGIAGESPMISLSELDQKDHLGGAATVAVQLAALGAEPVLLTGLGRDSDSDRASKQLQDAGVQVRAVRNRQEMPVKTRFLVDDHKLFKVDRAPVCPLDSIGERSVADVLVEHAARADAAIIYDCGLGMITPGLLQHLGATFRHRVPVIAGGAADPRGNLTALRYFDLLCCSERTLRTAMNDFGTGLSTLAYRLLQKTQAKQTIVTLGKRGLVTFDRRSHDRDSAAWNERLYSEHLPSFADRVVDRLGCSESVLAVAALALAGGAGLMQAAYLGAIAAAVQIASLGLVAADTDRILRCVRRRPESAGPDDAANDSRPPAAAKPGSAHELSVV
jgi:rfaE bifunctional protein kinase chain/domain/rfaE bifunctional protein nucleotidyltransferase chain/domain